MDKETVKQGLWTWAADVLHLSAKSIGALMVVGAFVLTVGGWLWVNLAADHVATEVQKLNGTPAIVTAIEAVDKRVEEQNIRIEHLGEQVEAITPEPQVTEFDPLRTRGVTTCQQGAVCEVQMRVRRTEFGKACGTPTVLNRTFVDTNGLITSPRPSGSRSPSKASGEWTVRIADFIPPIGVAEGVGEYYMLLEYPDCVAHGPDGREIVIPRTEQETYHARVTIGPKIEDAP